jgi:MFS-type transporter involved in bile tolerance (Atg22 family)
LAFLAAAVGLAALELGLLLPVLGFSADLAALRLETDALMALILNVTTCMMQWCRATRVEISAS